MAKIVFTWELGHGYGHISKFPLLANTLRDMGHDCVFICKNLLQSEKFLGSQGYRVLQAPINSDSQTQHLPLAINYAELLVRQDWLNQQSLCSRYKAWQELFNYLQPDIVVINHSPTALLVARTSNIPCIQFGTGFECPALLKQIPAFKPWLEVEISRLVDAEQKLLSAVNDTLTQVGKAELTQLNEIFDTPQFVCSYPELDPYAILRPETRYLGPVNHTSPTQQTVSWPKKVSGKRVFIYLKADFKGLEALLHALKQSKLICLLHIPGLHEQASKQFQSKLMQFSIQPINLEHILNEVDFVICNGGHGLISQVLSAGCPLLVMPAHVEQWINVQMLSRLNVAIELKRIDNVEGYSKAIKQMAQNAQYRRHAEKFSRTLLKRNQINAIQYIADQIKQLITPTS